MERKEWGQKYLNPHALDKFRNDIHADNLCRECAYFANLQINTDQSSEFQTRMQYFLTTTGIFLSPAFWVMLELPFDYPELIIVSMGGIYLSIAMGLFLLIRGKCCTKRATTGNRVTRMDGWFQGIRSICTLHGVRFSAGSVSFNRQQVIVYALCTRTLYMLCKPYQILTICCPIITSGGCLQH